MGDVGSGYLGFLIAVVAVKTAAHNAIALPTWLILGAVFFVDATVTFLRRLIRGKSVYIAHRSHAYQRLTRRWKSHARVTVTILLVDVLWLLPLATLAVSFPTYALWFVLAALTPLVALALRLGAGHDD
jgi:Fuc2NAc and GlcNAc transferase